ncbi:type IX secretion system membrane protein PorP/SprF, partial [Bacteroidales bacterium OttesenSCG-928-J19]|nr:type IX secretion system membrane protein PorP/SprF [Bacteroidales bacterium OttesenSCG-928-J19]
MKKALFIFCSLLLTACFTPVKAQFDAQFSNYWAAPNYFNPAAIGMSDKINLTALGRLQWVGVEGAPKTVHVLADLPWNFSGRRHGLGVSMYTDRAGLFSTNVMSGQYSYKTKLWGGELGVGVQVGYVSETFNADSIYIPGENDYMDPTEATSFSGKMTDNTIDAGFGVYYANKKMYAGLSVTHLVAPRLELSDKAILEIPRAYYFLFGYNIQLNNPLLELQPSFLLKTMEPSSFEIENDSIYTKSFDKTLKAMWTQTQLDVNVRLVYNKMLWLGASWRGATLARRESAIAMLGIKFKSFELGYSFDYPLNAFGGNSWGSH